jgi:uncharacterized small protein (DUF1192 family)
MANIVQALKAEISRISKKEAKAALRDILKSNIALKKTVADLKKRLALLEKDNSRLRATQVKKQAATPQVPAEEGKKARITSKGVRASDRLYVGNEGRGSEAPPGYQSCRHFTEGNRGQRGEKEAG